MEIKQMLTQKNCYPDKNKPEYVVVHETDNWSPGAGAVRHGQAMQNGNLKGTVHYYVDDKNIVQTLRHTDGAWAVGDGGGKYGVTNYNSINLEICVNPESDYYKAVENAAWLVRHLMAQTGIGIDNVVRHYDASRKNCPRRIMSEGRWDSFKASVRGGETGAPENVAPPPAEPAPKAVDVYYWVATQKHGMLPKVKNLEDFAGYEDSPVTKIAVQTTEGRVKYRVHIKGGKWLPYVTRYDANDHVNGYAGNGKPIDAVEVYFYTPSGMATKKAKYRVATAGRDYYPWQYDNETGGGQDGYAGAFGRVITRLQIDIA